MSMYAARALGYVARRYPKQTMRALSYVPRVIAGAQTAYQGYQAGKAVYRGGKRLQNTLKSVLRLRGGGNPVVKSVAPKRGRPKGTKNKTKTNKSGRTKKYNYNTIGLAKGFFPNNEEKQVYDKTYNIKGSVKINEFGGTLTANSTNALYLCHSIPSTEICYAWSRAIVKELMRQANRDITNWDEQPYINNRAGTSTVFRITTTFISNPGVNSPAEIPSEVVFTPLNSLTYFEIARDYFDQLRAGIGSGDQPKELYNIVMYSIVNSNPVHYEQVASINLKQAKFRFCVDSMLTVQNRSLAEATTIGEAASERDDITNIDAVPLRGKVYKRPGSWRNYLDVAVKPSQGAGALGSQVSTLTWQKKQVADNETGIIQFTSQDNATGHLKKPPPGYVLGFKNDSPIIMNPGEVWNDKFKFECVLSTDTFTRKFNYVIGNSAANTTQSQRVEFGYISGIGLEKMLDSLRSSGAPLNLAYQLTQKIKCLMEYKKRTVSNPIVNDTSSPISSVTDKPSG